MTTPANREHSEHITAFLKDIADRSCARTLTGIAIGVVFDDQEYRAVSGWANVPSKTPVSDSTVFEVGSLSKLFTALLLARAVTKGEILLDDPVQAALGDAVTLPTDGQSQITYRSLANHRSSLPRLPDDLIATADMENPYVHYDQAMLYACLNRMKPLRPIGSSASYSNFGVGLLGHALGKLAGSDYRVALKERVLIPLGMLDTSTESNSEQSPRLATAHKRKDKPTKHWDFTEVTVAAGGVRSPLPDMLKFLRANVRPETSTLSEEFRMMRETSDLPHHEGRNPKRLSWLGWLLPLGYVAALALFELYLHGTKWLARGGLDGLLFFSLMLFPTLAAACYGGRIASTATLALMTLLTWSFWGAGVPTFIVLVWGACLIYIFSGWKRNWAKFLRMLQGDGRLAWQSSEIGAHPVLWHNGMVGGSASYLGVVDALGVGVVVLTNTAKSVDAVGTKILDELVRLKEADRSDRKLDQ